MKLRLEIFCENLQKFDFKEFEVGFNYHFADGRETIWGMLPEISGKPLPSYNPDEDRWYSFEDDEQEEDDWGVQEFQFDIHQEGIVGFSSMGDIDVHCYNILYNSTEFLDFLKIHPIANENILNKKISYKEFKLKDVVDEILISVSTKDAIYFRPLSEIKNILDPKIFNRLIDCIYDGDWDFLVSISNYYSFCIEQDLIIGKESMIPFESVPIIFHNDVITNSSPGIDLTFPYLGISVKEGFSSQYLFDFLRQSKDGKVFLKDLKNSLLKNQSLNILSISAPNSFIHQIKYSTEFRTQYNVYKNEAVNSQNHENESINDLNDLYKNRRENIKGFVLDKNSSTLLDILKNPLPYNLEKSYRAYVRAGKDLDRLRKAGKLYNLILKLIVYYPLEEILHLELDKEFPEIQNILDQINGDRPISDGTWLDYFNTIAAVIGKNHEKFKLVYFYPLVSAIQLEYNGFREIIPVRNDWAHYRDDSAEFLKILDAFLPRILNILRNALKGNVFLLVESQNHKKDGLYITAKKIMGYEVDIETVEFKTALEGKHFIQGSLIAYNEKAKYTIPLENFFSFKIVQSEEVQIGIYKGGAAGEGAFEY